MLNHTPLLFNKNEHRMIVRRSHLKGVGVRIAVHRQPLRLTETFTIARIGHDGGLVDVCTGTGKQKSLRDYLDRPAILGSDPRGGAMALLLATELAAN